MVPMPAHVSHSCRQAFPYAWFPEEDQPWEASRVRWRCLP